MTSIAQRVAEVRRDIAATCARCGRAPDQVRLIAVTKNQTPDVLSDLAAAGIRDIGENRVDHQALMLPEARRLGLAVHAIGRIQGRQLAELIPMSDALHSLADVGHVERLARAAASRVEPLPIFVQVNASGEASKAGIALDQIAPLLEHLRRCPQVIAVGLMTMAPEGADELTIRQIFTAVRRAADDHRLPRCSMGMSQDALIAVECGSTDVRIGTRLFT